MAAEQEVFTTVEEEMAEETVPGAEPWAEGQAAAEPAGHGTGEPEPSPHPAPGESNPFSPAPVPNPSPQSTPTELLMQMMQTMQLQQQEETRINREEARRNQDIHREVDQAD